MNRPKLLFISPRFLFPLDQGGKIRTVNILRCLKGGPFELILASPAPLDHASHALDVAAICDRFVWWVESSPSQAKKIKALGSRLPVSVVCDRSAVGECVVRNALGGRPDLSVIDFPHATILVPTHIDCFSIMFAHNIETEIFERHANRARSIRRLIWKDQCRKMARFERYSSHKYDTILAVSERDRDMMAQRYQLQWVDAIDTGVDLDYFADINLYAAPDPGSEAGTIVFTATMSWAANIDGIHYLLDQIFPLLLKSRPKIRAIIIGRNAPISISNKIKERNLDVTLTGYVDDIRPYVALANVYVIPLFVGSGTRIKAFEAMAMGRPVVSTTVGVEGLGVTSGTHFLLADNAESFARSILALMDDGATSTRIATAARQLVEERFTWTRVAQQFESICLRTLERCYVALQTCK